MKRIGIIGASGFLGLNFSSYFSSIPEFELICTSRKPKPAIASSINAQWLVLDLFDTKAIQNFVQSVDVVIYLAHEGLPTSEGDWKTEAENNLIPFLNFLEQIKQRKSKSPLQLIYLSSGGAVYGPSHTLIPWKETDQPSPSTSYGILKLSAEHHLQHAVESGICTAVSLRVSNPYGNYFAHVKEQGIIDVAINKIENGQCLKLFASRSFVRDFLHIDDLNRAVESVIRSKCQFEIINIGSGIGTTIDSVLEEIEKAAGQSLRVESIPSQPNLNAISWSVLDISKADRLLHWKPTISFTQGIFSVVSRRKRTRV